MSIKWANRIGGIVILLMPFLFIGALLGFEKIVFTIIATIMILTCIIAGVMLIKASFDYLE